MYLSAITPPPCSTLYNKHLVRPGSYSFSIRELSHPDLPLSVRVSLCLFSSFPHRPPALSQDLSPLGWATRQEECKEKRAHFHSIMLGKGPRQLVTPHPQPGSRGARLPGLTFSLSFSVLDPSSWNSGPHVQTTPTFRLEVFPPQPNQDITDMPMLVSWVILDPVKFIVNNYCI